MAEWRIHCKSREGVAMVSSAMSRERAIRLARDLELIGDRIVKIVSEDGEVVPEVEIAVAPSSCVAKAPERHPDDP